MIEPFLFTNNLMGYVDDSIPCLSKTSSFNDGATVPKKNPNYPIWVSNDAHVRMLIISTISKASFRHVQEYVDALTAIGEPIKDKDLVMLVVPGLREEYNDLKATITARQSPTAFSELHALLSDHDYMLGKTRAPAPLSPTIRSTPDHLVVGAVFVRNPKKRNTMAMISAFTTVDKTAHNSRNDAHVRMLIISTISKASFRHVQGTTSCVLWLSFEKTYASDSTSKEYTLKTQLLRIKMHGDETPDAYLNRAQEYADALTAIGEPIKDKDLVMLVVSSLRKEYNGLKATITARQSPTAFSELHALLSDHDYMLGKTRAPTPSITLSFSANYAVGSPMSPIAPSSPQAFYGARPSNNNKNNNNNNRGNRNNSRGNNNRGRDNGRQFDWGST
nr:hypothetical protein [Tanacetum cinerariifolium]